MQLIVKCITVLSLMLHVSVSCGAICICNHTSATESSIEQHCHHHSHHEDSNHSDNSGDCCCKKCQSSFMTASTIQILKLEESSEIQYTHSVSSSITPSPAAYCNQNDLCNSCANTIRLRAQIWLI